MATDEEYTLVSGGNIGLDRADINQHGQIELPEKSPRTSHAHHESLDEDEGRLHRVRVSISEKKHDAATKIRKTLRISKPPSTIVDDELQKNDSMLANPVTEASESRLREQLPVPEKATVKDFLHHPVDTAKDKVSNQGNHEIAANIAAREVSHGQDVDLLHAHEELQGAETRAAEEKAEATLEELVKERQNMFVRWTLDRHITKVRILPKNSIAWPGKDDFVGNDGVVDWRAYGRHILEYIAHKYGGQYVGYGMDHPAPSKKTIMPNVERLIVASAPFQEFIMTTRRVYRWENPSETAKYLVIYSVLWYFDLVLPGLLSAFVYFVLSRKFHEPTMRDLRQDIERTENRQATALTLTEFVEKEGDEEWADRILEQVGPWLMVQLADLANFFEVMRNFYEWRTPIHTIATLSIFVSIILATALVPAWLFIRCLTLGFGVSFFALFPFAIHFPEYRLLASLPKRVFWNIPTHAEWAIKAIQAEGTRYQQTHSSTISPPSNPSPQSQTYNPVDAAQKESGNDYGQYTAYCDSQQGHLSISHFSLHFTSSHNTVTFTIPYSAIERVEKINRMVEQTLPLSKLKSGNGKDLKIVVAVGDSSERKEWVLTDVDLRDQVFSQILAFSKTAWQVVW
ncbi:hypothetical protein P280DRAFT_520509 [Massarina eburnea CBS 473.64]|uniref:GRAM domain-containing protein n=1 Tax=Massarina eburnea CBS 473.64 TaxID=1395130 RepID=A0A6A6RQM5_9PLEO|nr:hypothetical protein P280DRAFT_520509 [Massarina eburnea CBS 473.64]